MRRLRVRRLRFKLWLRSWRNRAHGYACTSCQRCRICEHTVYSTDRRGAGCRYCP